MHPPASWRLRQTITAGIVRYVPLGLISSHPTSMT